ncbi:MAG: hypothetical protein AB1644_12640 [Candidatus Zixiibacteriota bacterium]
MRNKLFVWMAALVLGFLCWSCSDDDQPIKPEVLNSVTGQVVAWRCELRDPVNNPPGGYPYASLTERRALLTFVDSSGKSDSCLTDDSSWFEIQLPSGLYSLIVETDFTYPDTVQEVRVTHDIVFDVDVWWQWVFADTLLAVFPYRNPDDSLGELVERAYLQFLQDRVGDVIHQSAAPRRMRVIFPDTNEWLYVYYSIPLAPEIRMWHVYDEVRQILQDYASFFPNGFRADPGFATCLH